MGAADRSLHQTLHHMGSADRSTIANLCLVQFSFLQKPCGFFVPFDDDDDDDFFDRTTTNLCDAA